MTTTKLTVRVPRSVVEDAKDYARSHDTTLTRLISEYLRRLSADTDFLDGAPIVRRLSGTLSPEASVDDYHRYLEDKYGE